MNYRNILKNITAFSIFAAVLISSNYQVFNNYAVHAASSEYFHDAGVHTDWTEWTNTAESEPPLPQTDGNYYLNKDFKIGPKDTYEIKGNVNFCLNGHNLTMGNSGRFFQFSNGTINIFNCESIESTISSKFSGNSTIQITENAILTIENCDICSKSSYCVENSGGFVAKNCKFFGFSGEEQGNGITLQSSISEMQRLEGSTVSVINDAVTITGTAPVEIVNCTISSKSTNAININNDSTTVNISGTNISTENGYGINCNGNLKLSGNNTITGSEGDIFIGTNKAIDINGALTNEEPISIVTAVEPTDDVPVVFTNSVNTEFNDPEKFKSFKPGYKVEKNSEGQLQLTTGAKKHSMNVTYTVEPSYTVTIPANINLQIGSSTSAEVKVENVCIPYDESVNVIISRASPPPNDDKFHVQSGTNILDYKINKSDTGSAISVNDNVLSVPSGTKESITTLIFTPPESFQYSGTYAGTITFTVFVS